MTDEKKVKKENEEKAIAETEVTIEASAAPKKAKPKKESKPRAVKKDAPKEKVTKKADAKVASPKEVTKKDTSSKVDKKPKKTKATASKKADDKIAAPKSPKKEMEPETEVLKAKEVKAESEGPAVKEETPPKAPAPKAKSAPRKTRRLSPMELKKREALKGYENFKKVRTRYYSFLRRTVKQSKPTTSLFNTIANVRPELTGITRNEVKRFDAEFIEKIERVIPSLEEIVVNPHKFINEFAEVVQVEKARKLTPRAVKYMAQNAEHVAEVLDDGRVVPKKVLNVFVDDDLKIYENRFIMTLIKRLQIFIELRHKYIREHGDTRNTDQITIQKEVTVDETVFHVDAKITMSVPSDDEGARESNNDLLERLQNIRRRTQFLVHSRFMREMAKAVPVSDPIQQTNIIRLNWAYQDAYKLWQFIHRYEELGISYTTTQAKIDFDEKYIDKINQFALNSFFTIETKHARLGLSNVEQKNIRPIIKAGELDFDLSDDRFAKPGLPVRVSARVETAEQEAARLKREAAREQARLKREEAKRKQKEREALKKARAKERALKRKLEAAERAKKRKEEAKQRQIEKNLERARIRAEKERLLAERKAYQKLMMDEAKKLRLARKAVEKQATEEREKAKQDAKRQAKG
ncbi:MAG: DUF2357 domain-containing protein [Bacilli bacterium]|jgi:hypothetical protein